MCDNDADKIVTNKGNSLWLGNAKAALDYDFLKENNISIIVNCTPDIPFVYQNTDNNEYMNFETIRIPMNDTSSESDNNILKNNLKHVIKFISLKFFHEKKNVLIHCRAGVSRSASVMLAFLFYSIKKNIKQNNFISELSDDDIIKNIINYMLKRRSCVFFYGTRLNFKKALDDYFNTDISVY
jgi:hypothetical protein